MKTLKAAFVLLVCALILYVSTTRAQAQEAEIGIYQQTLFADGDATPRLFSEGYSYLGESYGVWGFGYAEEEYVSAVAGLFYNNGSFEVGLAAGAETYPEEDGRYNFHPRLAGTMSYSTGDFFALAYYEGWSNADGWLRVQIDYQMTERWAFGAIHQTGDGTGPRVVYSIPRTPIQVWAAPMFGEEDTQFLIGIEFIFQRGE